MLLLLLLVLLLLLDVSVPSPAPSVAVAGLLSSGGTATARSQIITFPSCPAVAILVPCTLNLSVHIGPFVKVFFGERARMGGHGYVCFFVKRHATSRHVTSHRVGCVSLATSTSDIDFDFDQVVQKWRHDACINKGGASVLRSNGDGYKGERTDDAMSAITAVDQTERRATQTCGKEEGGGCYRLSASGFSVSLSWYHLVTQTILQDKKRPAGTPRHDLCETTYDKESTSLQSK